MLHNPVEHTELYVHVMLTAQKSTSFLWIRPLCISYLKMKQIVVKRFYSLHKMEQYVWPGTC